MTNSHRPSNPKQDRVSVPRSAAGERLDRFLAARAGGVPTRSRFAKLIDDGHVLVNGRRAKPAQSLRDGDSIDIEFPTPEPSHLIPEAIPLRIVFEDEHLLVIDKPAGLVVHPGSGVRTGTLVHALLHHTQDLSRGGTPERPGIVHRLDKETSGLLVVAKNEAAHVGLARDLAARRLRRVYGCVTWGAPRASGRVDAPIGRDRRDRKKMGVRDDGRAARTNFTVLESFEFTSLLDVALDTGRTHQIRVHLAHIGHPVFGDPLYGGRAGAISRFVPPSRAPVARAYLGMIARQSLHARRLAFVHPATGRELEFVSDFPPDIEALVSALRDRVAPA
ncbi:MAG: RluA family pseudouridine synthase [bacterium]